MGGYNELSPAWQKRIEEIDTIVRPLLAERAVLQQNILEMKSVFKVGDIIEWDDGKRCGQVRRIMNWTGGEPMWLVTRIRKDGSEGFDCKVRHYQGPVLVKAV